MVISTQGRYTRTAIVLHWLILALLVAQYIVGWTMPHIGRNTPVTTLISLHFSIGVLILGLIVVRLIWRILHGEPTPEAGIPPWQVRSARVIHWLLYLLLVVVPLLGWINASSRVVRRPETAGSPSPPVPAASGPPCTPELRSCRSPCR